jgi:microcompartment protein CcmL/EutN
MIAELRAVVEPKQSLEPQGRLYRMVLGELAAVEDAISSGALAAHEASRPLGVLAVGEVDDGASDAQVCDAIFAIKSELRRLANLPWYA